MISGKGSGFTIFERHFKVKKPLPNYNMAGLQYDFSAIKYSLQNGRDFDLNQIENAFKDPEDGFWEKNSSEGIVGNSDLY